MVIPRVLAKVTGNLHQSCCRAGGLARMGGLGRIGRSRQDGGPPFTPRIPQQFLVVQMGLSK